MKFLIYTLIAIGCLSGTSCKKYDNYKEPDQTLTGTLIDVTTGKPIQLQPGGAVIRLEELSWAEKTGAAVIPQDFNVKPDGTFNNTKLFSGSYLAYPFNGPFVPYYSTDSGNPLDKRQKVEIQGGSTTIEFQVEPLLKVEWVGQPVLNADKTVTVSFRFSRGTSNSFYIRDVDQAWLYISNVPYLGDNTRDPNLSNSIVYSGTSGNTALGTTVSLTSKLPLGNARTYYLRVGARTKDNIGQRFNYTDVKSIDVP